MQIRRILRPKSRFGQWDFPYCGAVGNDDWLKHEEIGLARKAAGGSQAVSDSGDMRTQAVKMGM